MKRWRWPKLAEGEAVAWQVVALVDLVYEGCPSQDGGSDIGTGGKTPPCVWVAKVVQAGAELECPWYHWPEERWEVLEAHEQ